MTAQRENKRSRELFIYFLFCQDVSRSLSAALPSCPSVPRPLLRPSRPAPDERQQGHPGTAPAQDPAQLLPWSNQGPQKLSFRPTHGSLATSVSSSNSPAITPLGMSRGAFHPFLTFPYRTLPVLKPEFYFYTSSPLIKRNIKVNPFQTRRTNYVHYNRSSTICARAAANHEWTNNTML